MVELVSIYALCHPDTNEVRYIGMTKNRVNRMICHKYAAFNKRGHFNQWKRAIYQQDKKPEYVELESVPFDAWEDAEIFWISYFKSLEARLLNRTTGGNGTVGYIYTTEDRKRMSLERTGRTHSEETKAKIAFASSQYRHTDETKAKLSEIHKNLSEEVCINMGKAQIEGYLRSPERLKLLQEHCRRVAENNVGRTASEETKQRISLAQKGIQKGRLTDEQVRDIALCYVSKSKTTKELCLLYNISSTSVRNIASGKVYTHVDRREAQKE